MLTGRDTTYSHLAERLQKVMPETAFDCGLRGFSLLISRTVLLLVLFVALVNITARHNPFQSLLFAVALAVGLDILCNDKTGTLTEGRMQVSSITDASGKGAPESVIEVCSAVVEPQGEAPLDDAARAAIDTQMNELGDAGSRVLGVEGTLRGLRPRAPIGERPAAPARSDIHDSQCRRSVARYGYLRCGISVP